MRANVSARADRSRYYSNIPRVWLSYYSNVCPRTRRVLNQPMPLYVDALSPCSYHHHRCQPSCGLTSSCSEPVVQSKRIESCQWQVGHVDNREEFPAIS